MCDEILNITNGDYFNKYFISHFGGVALPFCEVMMDGETTEDIYSERFIKIRSQALNVSEKVYRAKMQVYDALNTQAYSTIRLWFGKDTFCQMNLLMLLAYLEQIGYQGKLTLHYIDDETFEVVKGDISVELGIYGKIYKEVLISKRMPDNVGVLYAEALDLYFDYHAKNGKLANLVRENADKDTTALIELLLKTSKAYGLSDLQAEKLIKANL